MSALFDFGIKNAGREHKKLLRLWATRRATRKQIERCMELDRRTIPSPDFGVAAERVGLRSPAVTRPVKSAKR